MKTLTTFLVLMMVSCSNQNNEAIDLKNDRQTWKLVKMTGSLQNSETTGTNMAWQEQIQLIDGRFEKERMENGRSTKISGSYEFSDEVDGRYLILKYVLCSCQLAQQAQYKRSILLLV